MIFTIRAGLQAATPPKSAIEEFARHGCSYCKSTLLEVGQQRRGVSFSRCCDSPEPQKKGALSHPCHSCFGANSSVFDPVTHGGFDTAIGGIAKAMGDECQRRWTGNSSPHP